MCISVYFRRRAGSEGSARARKVEPSASVLINERQRTVDRFGSELTERQASSSTAAGWIGASASGQTGACQAVGKDDGTDGGGGCRGGGGGGEAVHRTEQPRARLSVWCVIRTDGRARELLYGS